jgi:hypothetical protein
MKSGWYASQLRQELRERSWHYARTRLHVESYGAAPVIVYAPDGDRHGNFYDAAYESIVANAGWARRFDKVHAQGRALPKAERRWRELDSSMSSDALLMNIFCTPGVVESKKVQQILGIQAGDTPIFGWKARVPLGNGRFDRTEVDMKLGSLLVEAKLTESNFQRKGQDEVESYRDFDTVFARDLVPKVSILQGRRKYASEFPEDYSQEYEAVVGESGSLLPTVALPDPSPTRVAYSGYQLIRNVLAASAHGCSFCVMDDARRPDLREEWFSVMSAVRPAALRVRLQVITWQELAAALPRALQEFLEVKYGILAVD